MRLTPSLLTMLIIQCAFLAGCGFRQHHTEAPTLRDDARTMSADEIAKRVRHTREQLANLDITYTFASSSPLPANAIAWEKRRVVLAESKMFVDRESGVRDGEGVSSMGWYDGTRVWLYRQSARQAEVSSDAAALHDAIATEGSGFFDLMRWYPDHTICFDGMHHLDLLLLIESPSARIRAEQESIDSRLCIVIDNLDRAGNTLETVWLDTTRGLLPIRQELRESAACGIAGDQADGAGYRELFRDFARRGARPHVADQEGVVTTTFVIDDAREIVPGVWVPIAGRRLTETTSFDMNVRIDDAGQPQVVVGRVAEDTFDPEAALPEGTHVIDIDTEQVSVIRR